MKFEEFVTESFKSYLEKMEKGGSWAEWLMIFAAVNSLNRPISIISSIGEDGLRIIEPLSSFGKSRQALLLGHLAEVHYYSLQPSPNVSRDIFTSSKASASQLSKQKSSSDKESVVPRKRYTDMDVGENGDGMCIKNCKRCEKEFSGYADDINYVYANDLVRFYSKVRDDDYCSKECQLRAEEELEDASRNGNDADSDGQNIGGKADNADGRNFAGGDGD